MRDAQMKEEGSVRIDTTGRSHVTSEAALDFLESRTAKMDTKSLNNKELQK